jgi:hypothetical protein
MTRAPLAAVDHLLAVLGELDDRVGFRRPTS